MALPSTMGIDKFITKCDQRTKKGPSYPCRILSLATGHDYGVAPNICAHCRLNGQIDQEYLNTIIANNLMHMAVNAHLGFYEEHERISIFEHAYKYADDKDKKFAERLDKLLAGCVELARIPLHSAQAIAKMHGRTKNAGRA